MNAKIRTTVETYAREELGRAGAVAAVLDHGREALVLFRATDGASFALLLERGLAGEAEWIVVDETDVDDFARNAHRDNAFEAARIAAEILDTDDEEAVEQAERAVEDGQARWSETGSSRR